MVRLQEAAVAQKNPYISAQRADAAAVFVPSFCTFLPEDQGPWGNVSPKHGLELV
jgi:hypothetical protein